jgi:hypothetical protein
MSNFTDKDYSLVESKPIECYKIYSSDGESYLYTTDSDPVIIDGVGTFYPENIAREDLSENNTPFDSEINLNMDSQSAFVRMNNFRYGKPALEIEAYRVQRDNGAYAIFYMGIVSEILFNGETASVKCKFFGSVLNNKIITYFASRSCPHLLYGSFCKAVKANYTFSGVINSFYNGNGSMIVSSSFAGKSVLYGSLYNVNTKEFRAIYDVCRNDLGVAVPNSARIIRPFITGNVLDPIILTYGCAKTEKECMTKFANFKNFGGFNDIPVEDPYSYAKIMRYL